MESADERELWIVGREFERPPYFHAGKGGDTRLARALRLCTEDKITPNSDGSYQVQGAEGRSYRVAESCSCPQSQKANSRWCYHAVGVALYVEWRKRCATTVPPLGTVVLASDPDDLAQETLALGPANVDERLAAPPAMEAPMPDNDDSQYIPEPDDLPPVAVEDPPAPVPLRIPREYTVQIKGRTHVLYTGLVVTARTQGLMSLSADWTYNDAELSLAHAVCTFADGRRYEESGDATPSNVSKGIAAHFRRVALTRAKARCLRDALGISECSVEELEEDTGKRETPDMTQGAPEDLKKQIWARIKQQAPDVQRAEVGTWVWEHTGLALSNPTNYPQILAKLSAVGR